MENLNSWGDKHLATYLKHYAEGKLSYKDVKLYVGCCFEVRK